MKKVVALVLVAVVFVISVAFGLRYMGNKLEEAFQAGVEHAINNAIIDVVKVANNLYEVRIELDGEVYVHEVESILEEAE